MLFTSLLLGALVAGSIAQQTTKSESGIVVADWNFRYDILGNPVAVILKDDMHGLMNPLRSRIVAFLGPLAGLNFLNNVINTDLGRALDKPFPDLNGTRAWSRTELFPLSCSSSGPMHTMELIRLTTLVEIMQWEHDQPIAINFRTFHFASQQEIG